MTPPIRIKHKSKPSESRKEVVNVPISIIDNYKKDINTLKNFIKDLEIKNKKYENKIHTSSLENSEKTKFINELEKKYVELEKKYNESQNKNDELGKEYNQLEDRYNLLEKKKIQLDVSDKNPKNRISLLLKEKQNNNNKNKSLLNEIETFKETIKTLEDEILKKNKNIKDADENKKNLEDTYKKEIERLTFILNKKKENENKMFMF